MDNTQPNTTAPAEGSQNAAPQQGPAAEGIPAKFLRPDGTPDVAALARSYTELERANTALRQNPSVTAPKPQAAPQQAPAGFPAEAILSAIAQQGGLTEGQYAQLQQMGHSKSFVDSYVEGQKAIGERRANEVYSMVGGKEAYDTAKEWASANFSAEEKQTYTRVMNQGSPAEVKWAVEALMARYQAANGTAPQMSLEGTAKPGGKAMAFDSKHELVKAMSDPRYQKDSAYRAEIERALMQGNVGSIK